MKRASSGRIVVPVVIVAVLLATTGLSLLPVLYWRAERAEQNLEPLKAHLASAHADLEETRKLAIVEKEDADKARGMLVAQSALAEKAARLQAAFDHELVKLESKDRELSESRTALASSNDQLKRLRNQSMPGSKQLIEMQKLLGAEAPDRALAVLRKRLDRLRAVEEENAEYMEIANGAGVSTPTDLRNRMLAMKRDAEVLQSKTLAMAPSPLPPIVVTQMPPTATAYCQLPTALPAGPSLKPGEVLIKTTGWYRVEMPPKKLP